VIGLGRIAGGRADALIGFAERDQVHDYADRKNMPIADVERWLGPVLNYIPTPASQAAE